MGDEIKVQNGVEMNVSVGGNVQQSDGTSYGAGTAGAGITIPIGKNFTVNPQANGSLGKDIKGVGFQLGTSTQVAPRLSIAAGVGVNRTSFSGNKTEDYTDYANAQLTPMNGKEALMQTGDFMEQGTIHTQTNSKQTETEGYLFGGVKYNVKPNLAVSFGGELGYKNTDQAKISQVKDFAGQRCTQGAEMKYTQIGEDYYDYVWTGKPTIAQYSGQETADRTISSSGVVGGITAGVEYDINNNLALGVNGKVGIGKEADSNVGLNLKVKF